MLAGVQKEEDLVKRLHLIRQILQIALMYNYLLMKGLQQLLVFGADPNVVDGANNTVMNIACATDAANCIDLLMNFGADLSIPSFKGYYPVHKVLYRGSIEVLEKLIKYCN